MTHPTTPSLPPLPEPQIHIDANGEAHVSIAALHCYGSVYTADQMRAYATSAVRLASPPADAPQRHDSDCATNGMDTLNGIVRGACDCGMSPRPLSAPPADAGEREAFRELLAYAKASKRQQCSRRFDFVIENAEKALAALSAPLVTPSAQGEDSRLLDALDEHPSWSVQNDYADNEDGPSAWLIYEERGSPNDREWIRIGAGATVRDALRAALAQKGGV